MKNLTLYAFILSIAFCTYSTAQVVNTTPTEPGEFNIEFDEITCFDKSAYPTVEDALDQILFDNMGFTFCDSGCPFQPLVSCTTDFLNADDIVTETAEQWCFQGSLLFQWDCGTGAPPTPTPNPNPNPNDIDISEVGGAIPGANDLPGHSTPKNHQVINALFPNPSTGIVNIIFDSFTPTSSNALVITDWMGRKIKIQDLNSNEITDARVELDLSRFGDGIYFAALYQQGEKTATQKFLIQH